MKLTRLRIVRSCATWQRRLRLQDWDVELTIQRARDMPEDGLQGFCSQHETKRRAYIALVDPVDADPGWDWEVTLVHELLHVPMSEVLKGDYRKSPEGIAAERFIDAQARALVAGYRGQR